MRFRQSNTHANYGATGRWERYSYLGSPMKIPGPLLCFCMVHRRRHGASLLSVTQPPSGRGRAKKSHVASFRPSRTLCAPNEHFFDKPLQPVVGTIPWPLWFAEIVFPSLESHDSSGLNELAIMFQIFFVPCFPARTQIASGMAVGWPSSRPLSS